MPSDALDAFIERRTLRTVPDRPMPLYPGITDHGPVGVWLRDDRLSDPAADVVDDLGVQHVVVYALPAP